jgi:hypothetical protein
MCLLMFCTIAFKTDHIVALSAPNGKTFYKDLASANKDAIAMPADISITWLV